MWQSAFHYRTKSLRYEFQKWKGLFSFPVLEVSIHGHVPLLPWSLHWGSIMAVACGRGSPFMSCHLGSEKKTKGKDQGPYLLWVHFPNDPNTSYKVPPFRASITFQYFFRLGTETLTHRIWGDSEGRNYSITLCYGCDTCNSAYLVQGRHQVFVKWSFQEKSLRAMEMAQSVKCLLHKHNDLS